MNSESSPTRLPRRQVLQWFAAAAAAPAFPGQAQNAPDATGYGTDPDLAKVYQPGDVWPLTFTDEQRKLVSALADTIIPADDLGPAASEVRVPDYIDEWISAPYPSQKADREVVLPGLAEFEASAQTSHGKVFADLSPTKRNAFCESIVTDADHPLGGFFHKFSMIALGAYYSTPEGWKAIGYVGNLPSGIFAGPPQEVLDRVVVAQTVDG